MQIRNNLILPLALLSHKVLISAASQLHKEFGHKDEFQDHRFIIIEAVILVNCFFFINAMTFILSLLYFYVPMSKVHQMI